jgi:hypothetical protein
MRIGREIGDGGPDVLALIKELAETGIDPAYVAEAVAIEQEEAEERRLKEAAAAAEKRPHLRVVPARSSEAAAGRE